jgi:hypothetical protein
VVSGAARVSQTDTEDYERCRCDDQGADIRSEVLAKQVDTEQDAHQRIHDNQKRLRDSEGSDVERGLGQECANNPADRDGINGPIEKCTRDAILGERIGHGFDKGGFERPDNGCRDGEQSGSTARGPPSSD